MEIFEVKGLSKWGDYGDAIINGWYELKPGGIVELTRTGPFIPPLTFPNGRPLVTDALKSEIEKSDLFRGCEFKPVKRAHIVSFNIQGLDTSSQEPPVLPRSGEPEDYLLKRPHSALACEALGDLWLLEPPIEKIVKIVESKLQLHKYKVLVNAKKWKGSNLFTASYTYVAQVGGRTTFQGLFTSAAGKEWLSNRLGSWAILNLCEAVQ